MSQKYRDWCFTLNNPTEMDDHRLTTITQLPEFIYMVYQREEGTEGTTHYQGYIEFAYSKRLTDVRMLLPRAHLERRRGTRDQAREYCMKEETSTGDPAEFGQWRKQGAGRVLEDFRDAILNGVDVIEHPEFFAPWCRYQKAYSKLREIRAKREAYALYAVGMRPSVYVIHGGTGVGKTRWVMDTFGVENVFVWSAGDGSKTSLFWDGADEASVCLLDDFYGNIPINYLLRLLDRYPMRLQVKFGYTWRVWTTIVITSNQPSKDWYNPETVPEKARLALQRRIDHEYDCSEGMVECLLNRVPSSTDLIYNHFLWLPQETG